MGDDDINDDADDFAADDDDGDDDDVCRRRVSDYRRLRGADAAPGRWWRRRVERCRQSLSFLSLR